MVWVALALKLLLNYLNGVVEKDFLGKTPSLIILVFVGGSYPHLINQIQQIHQTFLCLNQRPA